MLLTIDVGNTNTVFGVHTDNLKILYRNLFASQMTGHSLTLENPAGRGTCTV